MASIASQNNKSPDLGTHIMVAGLAFQVATLIGFVAFAADFTFRVYRNAKKVNKAEKSTDTDFKAVRQHWMFKGFLMALAISTFLILWRSIFRVAELSNGWHGSIIGNQAVFIAFEGVLIALAIALLNVFHPALCAPELFRKQNG